MLLLLSYLLLSTSSLAVSSRPPHIWWRFEFPTLRHYFPKRIHERDEHAVGNGGRWESRTKVCFFFMFQASIQRPCSTAEVAAWHPPFCSRPSPFWSRTCWGEQPRESRRLRNHQVKLVSRNGMVEKCGWKMGRHGFPFSHRNHGTSGS